MYYHKSIIKSPNKLLSMPSLLCTGSPLRYLCDSKHMKRYTVNCVSVLLSYISQPNIPQPPLKYHLHDLPGCNSVVTVTTRWCDASRIQCPGEVTYMWVKPIHRFFSICVSVLLSGLYHEGNRVCK